MPQQMGRSALQISQNLYRLRPGPAPIGRFGLAGRKDFRLAIPLLDSNVAEDFPIGEFNGMGLAG